MSPSRHQSVILIGMPGAGKSTIGVLLAKELGLGFLDTDLAIQLREGRTLQEILDGSDYLDLRRIEEEVLLETDCHGQVIATGGSAVYSEAGMAHLKACGPTVFLDVPLDVLRRRIHNYEHRGIARRPGQSFASLFEERTVLYRRYADLTVTCTDHLPGEVVDDIVAALAALHTTPA
ncbi:MAG: shikimate kinase [Gammaproteobacteria bacterium]|nr:shikimate kinase [Gammaproteobacteria bacterium]